MFPAATAGFGMRRLIINFDSLRERHERRLAPTNGPNPSILCKLAAFRTFGTRMLRPFSQHLVSIGCDHYLALCTGTDHFASSSVHSNLVWIQINLKSRFGVEIDHHQMVSASWTVTNLTTSSPYHGRRSSSQAPKFRQTLRAP